MGARKDAIELAGHIDRKPLIELRRKGIVKNIGGSRGRPGRIQLVVDMDSLVLSDRRRPATDRPATSHQRSASVTSNQPTVEELRAVLNAIDEAEREAYERLSGEAIAHIGDLKHRLAEAEQGSEIESTLFQELSKEMGRLKMIADEARVQALKTVESARRPYSALAAFISRERS